MAKDKKKPDEDLAALKGLQEVMAVLQSQINQKPLWVKQQYLMLMERLSQINQAKADDLPKLQDSFLVEMSAFQQTVDQQLKDSLEKMKEAVLHQRFELLAMQSIDQRTKEAKDRVFEKLNRLKEKPLYPVLYKSPWRGVLDALFSKKHKKSIAKTLAVYSAFTEGLQLFSSFAILLNFPRYGKMKGMGQIVTYSIRDESLHVEAMTKLFREFVKENPDIWTDDLKKELYDICRKMVELEDKFLDLVFEMGNLEGLTKDEMYAYNRYIADRRLLQLGLKPNFKQKDNPLEWIDEVIGVEHQNFFEGKATSYMKAGLRGNHGSLTFTELQNEKE